MGSRRTHEDRLARLREAGLGEEELARLRSPIGLDLGARTPEETAVSVAAELIQLRWGGSGRPLTRPPGGSITDGSWAAGWRPASGWPLAGCPVAVAGVLLAAGAGSRLGRPKALVEVDGVRLVDRGIWLLQSGGAAPLVVVTGAAPVTLPPA